jgi:hypothetical protein
MAGLIVWMVISTFLGFCGFVDCLAQPSGAYRTAGKSKAVWALVTFVGMISLVGGVATWLLYSYGGTRRALVRNGGYNRPSREKRIREMRRQVNREDAAQRHWDE